MGRAGVAFLNLVPVQCGREGGSGPSKGGATPPLRRFGERRGAKDRIVADSLRGGLRKLGDSFDLERGLVFDFRRGLFELGLERGHPRCRFVGQILSLRKCTLGARQAGSDSGSAVGKELSRKRSREIQKHEHEQEKVDRKEQQQHPRAALFGSLSRGQRRVRKKRGANERRRYDPLLHPSPPLPAGEVDVRPRPSREATSPPHPPTRTPLCPPI